MYHRPVAQRPIRQMNVVADSMLVIAALEPDSAELELHGNYVVDLSGFDGRQMQDVVDWQAVRATDATCLSTTIKYC